MIILVVYDISDNQVRAELANYLKTKGFVRVQRSFFIGRPTPAILRDVERVLPKYVASENDVIHLIPVPEIMVKGIRVYGRPLADVSTVSRLLVIA